MMCNLTTRKQAREKEKCRKGKFSLCVCVQVHWFGSGVVKCFQKGCFLKDVMVSAVWVEVGSSFH